MILDVGVVRHVSLGVGTVGVLVKREVSLFEELEEVREVILLHLVSDPEEKREELGRGGKRELEGKRMGELNEILLDEDVSQAKREATENRQNSYSHLLVKLKSVN